MNFLNIDIIYENRENNRKKEKIIIIPVEIPR